MGWLSVISIAVSLAMDAFAVSVSGGISIKKVQIKDALKIALCFALFQFIMPVIGWTVGGVFAKYIKAFDHWIAFALLLYIGVNMIREGRGDEEDIKGNILELKTLILMGIATSIDALIIGVNYAFVGTPILAPAAVIGIVTFGICTMGVYFGKTFGYLIGKRAEVAGGIVLILIGAKTLVEHLFFQ